MTIDTEFKSRSHNLTLAVSFLHLFALLGCGATNSVANSPSGPNLPIVSQTLRGKAMDGQQPIAGAHVYLLAANTTGYGNASVSLLVSESTGYSDSVGAYVLTASDGSFSMPGTYSCAAGYQQTYLYVQGGNAGLGVNTAIGELAALGDCPSLTAPTVSSLIINEVTTIAAAYAIAGFATDAIHVSSSGMVLAQTGVANAFAGAVNLASLSSGVALTAIPSGYASVPQTTINTLANILAACIDSAGPSSTECSKLLSNTELGSVEPSDTASAAINIAQGPANNIASLYALQTSTSPFSPALTTPPNDFSIALNFASVDSGVSNCIVIDGDGNVWLDNGVDSVIVLSNNGYLLSGSSGYTYNLYGPGDIAIDQSGNVWIGNYEAALPNPADPYSLVELTNSGTLLSGANGYAGGGLNSERGIAIDGAGNAWAANNDGNSVSKFSSAGIPFSVSPFTGGALNAPLNIAIDGAGSVWVPNAGGNSTTKLSNTGSILSGSAGFHDSGGEQGGPIGIAIDASGNAWATYPDPSLRNKNRVVKFSNTGSVLSGPNGYTGNGVGNGYNIAIDGDGNAWEGNYYGNSVVKLSSTGEVLSGANGYTGGNLYYPYAIAVDGSGNVWVDNYATITEMIGIATPVITPISAGLPATPTADGSSKLGTRP